VQAQKKLPQTDAIFARLSEVNRAADESESTLRLSLDAKTSVRIGLYSRGGRSWVRVEAADHDFKPEAKPTPFGILLPHEGELFLYFTHSSVTSDFMVDMLGTWWEGVRGRFPRVKTLLINQDNGPENSTHRRQYVKRLNDFAKEHALTVELACYPPYHSKYNPIERCWGVLEQHWDTALLDSIPTVLRFAKTMTWKGNHPLVELVTKSYSKGVTLTRKEMDQLETHIKRLHGLEKWFVTFSSEAPDLG
jgi:hypothetical protein